MSRCDELRAERDALAWRNESPKAVTLLSDAIARECDGAVTSSFALGSIDSNVDWITASTIAADAIGAAEIADAFATSYPRAAEMMATVEVSEPQPWLSERVEELPLGKIVFGIVFVLLFVYVFGWRK